MDNWHDFNKEVPQKAGEYLVAFYPVSFDRINNERMHVGIDVFRGGKRISRDSWAKHKSSYVCFGWSFQRYHQQICGLNRNRMKENKS